MDAKELYEKVKAKAETDQNVLGFILAAGRGKGISTGNSDYDIFLILKNDTGKALADSYKGLSPQ